MARGSTVTLASNKDYWQARYYDSQGKRRTKSLGRKKAKGGKSGLSRRQANVRCNEFAAELRRRPRRGDVGKAPTLERWLEQFLQQKHDLRPSSREGYRGAANQLMKFIDDQTRIDRITMEQAAAWAVGLKERVSDATVANYVRHVRCIFNEAVAQDLIVQNPFSRLKTKPRRIERNWHYVDRQLFTTILRRCPAPAWTSFLALQRIGALRRSEALAVRWPMVEWEQRLLRLPEHITKTARERIVPLDPELHVVLKDGYDATGDRGGPIVDDGLGNREPSGLRRNFHQMLRAMEIEPWEHTFQTLRRNAVQDLRAVLKDPWAVTCIAGHSEEVERTFYLGNIREEDIRVVTGQGVDTELERVKEAWPTLKASQRQTILGVVGEATAKRKKRPAGTKTGTNRKTRPSDAA